MIMKHYYQKPYLLSLNENEVFGFHPNIDFQLAKIIDIFGIHCHLSDYTFYGWSRRIYFFEDPMTTNVEFYIKICSVILYYTIE